MRPPKLLLALLCWFWCGSMPGAETAPPSTAPAWANPLVEQRADPQIFYHDGNYYLTATVPEYDRIELRRAPTLDGLRTAEPKVIWRKHAAGPMGAHIWAPELHRLDGKWYVYFAAGEAERIWNIRIYVLENAAADPFQGEWVEKGQLKTKWESFALDATVFEHQGARYLFWAQKDPDIAGNTNLYIAKMDTPWSIVQPQVMISKPDLEWEQIRYLVNEGPAPLVRNGKIFLTYSASATDANYCMGLLTAEANANLLDPASWKKSPLPVFATWYPNSQFGPGHGSFTTTPDGQTDIMVYHARNYRAIQGDPLRNPDRHTRAQVLKWKPDGTPDFSVPVADGPVPAPPPAPEGAIAPRPPSAATTATPSELLVNGNFASPRAPDKTALVIRPGAVPNDFGWQLPEKILRAGPVELQPRDTAASAAGLGAAQVLALNGVIEQTIPTTPGQSYILTFTYADLPYSPGTAAIMARPLSQLPRVSAINVPDQRTLVSAEIPHVQTRPPGSHWQLSPRLLFTARSAQTIIRFEPPAAVDFGRSNRQAYTGSLLLAEISVQPSAAESAPLGSITGTVVDGNNKPVPGASIGYSTEWRSSALGASRTICVTGIQATTTDTTGTFSLTGLPPGTYKVSAAKGAEWRWAGSGSSPFVTANYPPVEVRSDGLTTLASPIRIDTSGLARPE